MESTQAIQHGGSKSWLRHRRNRFAFWVAAAEAVVVAVFHGASSYTVMALAVVAVALYWFWGRNTRSDTGRQLTWIFAASQTLAFAAAILAVVIGTLVLIVAGIFAAVALFILFTERR